MIPVPYEHGEKTVVDVEFGRPTGAVLADTRRFAESGDIYTALATFLAGSIRSLETDDDVITDRVAIKAAVKGMPYVVSNWAAIQVFLNMGLDDTVDQQYACPRCKARFFGDDEVPDRIRDLPVRTAEAVPTVPYELKYPVEVKSKGEAFLKVTSIELRFPTLGDCIKAGKRIAASDQTRLQFAILVEALTHANGDAVDAKFRAEWGAMLFERMDIMDVRAILDELGRYGTDEQIEKRCPKCEKLFHSTVDVSGFFVSGLRQE